MNSSKYQLYSNLDCGYSINSCKSLFVCIGSNIFNELKCTGKCCEGLSSTDKTTATTQEWTPLI